MLSAKNLTIDIKKKRILTDIEFNIKPNTFTAVVGRNGSGKSTLVSCLAGVRRYEGEVYINGEELSMLNVGERAKRISVLPQMLAGPHMLVEDLVKMGRNPYLEIGQHFTTEDEVAVDRGLQIMGICNLRHCYVDEISGGERQKAYLAMILAQDTPLIVLDEPITYMDVEGQAEFLEILRRLLKEYDKTLLVVLHDLNLAAEYADNIIVLERGRLVFAGATEKCMESQQFETRFGVEKYSIDKKMFFSAKKKD